jgi:hypothetical protein
MPVANDNLLGTYLKDRRAKLDPATFGFPLTRRRTPGLRREEVAQRANVATPADADRNRSLVKPQTSAST